MPSPFPGMDPYLEGDLWTTLHVQLAVEIARQLTPHLSPRYLAFPEPTHQRITVMPSIPHSWVEIRDKAERKLVTMIEILSPTNKRGSGRKEYMEKRDKLLQSSAHLLEIDLLRKGTRVPMTEPLPAGAYFVCLTRANKRPESDIWAIALDEPLLKVRVPLLEPDPDVPLDLQQAFNTIYDLSRYDLAIDYTKPPDVALPKDTLAWARARIAAAGVTPTFTDEVAEFFAACPSPEELLAYRPSARAQKRFASLLSKCKNGSLGLDEEWELHQFERIEMLLQSIKARLH